MTAVAAISDKPKKTMRTKKTEATTVAQSVAITELPKVYKPLSDIHDSLSDLIIKTEQAEKEIADLQNKILETQKFWQEEQREHEKQVVSRDEEFQLARKREEEEYEYQKKMDRKKAEDEFSERKSSWGKELSQRKEEIEADKKELQELRVKATSFESELQKAVKEAQIILTKELEERYSNERKLREQEVKSEKELLVLKIDSLTKENSRQAAEIETLKKAFDETTRQLKDVAVKVIEGRTPKIIDSSEV